MYDQVDPGADDGVASVITNEEDNAPVNDTCLQFDGADTDWPHLRIRMKDLSLIHI